MAKDLVPADSVGDPRETSGILARTIVGIVEGLTGVGTSDRKDLVQSAGFILQRLRGVRLLDAFKAEWDRYREKGRIKDDYQATEQHAECLQELLDFLDQDSPDQFRFDALKKILLVSATEEHSSRDSVLPQQYMKLVRELGSGELLVLLTTYITVARGGWSSSDTSARNWQQQIADASGLKFPELVANHETKLMATNLLTPRELSDQSGVTRGTYNRLTEFGRQLCEFISN